MKSTVATILKNKEAIKVVDMVMDVKKELEWSATEKDEKIYLKNIALKFL